MPKTTFDSRLLSSRSLVRVATDANGDTYALAGDRSVLVFNRNYPFMPGRDSGDLGAQPVAVDFIGGFVWAALSTGKLVQLLLSDPADGLGLILKQQVGLIYRVNSDGDTLRNSAGEDRAIVGEVPDGGISVESEAANPLVVAGPSGVGIATAGGAGVVTFDATTGLVLDQIHGFLTQIAGIAYSGSRVYAVDGIGNLVVLACDATGLLSFTDQFNFPRQGAINPDVRVVQGMLALCSRETGRVTFLSLVDPDAPAFLTEQEYRLDPVDKQPVTALDEAGSPVVRSLDQAFLDFMAIPVTAAREHDTTSRVDLHSGGVSYPGGDRRVGRHAWALAAALGGPTTYVGGPVDVTVNENGNATFMATYSGFTNPTFQWYYWNGSSWVSISGETRSTLVLYGVLRAVDGRMYRCTVTDALGSLDSNSATLTVQWAPVVNSVAVSPASASDRWFDEQITLTASITEGGPASTKQWYLDGVLVPGATSNPYLPPIGWAGDGGDYKCVATNAAGASDSTLADVWRAARSRYQCAASTAVTAAPWILSPIFGTIQPTPVATPHPTMTRTDKFISGINVGGLLVPAGWNGKTATIHPHIYWTMSDVAPGAFRARLMIDRAAGGTETLLDRTQGISNSDVFAGVWDSSGIFPPGVSPYGQTILYAGDVVYALVEMVSWSYLGPSATLYVLLFDGVSIRSELDLWKADV